MITRRPADEAQAVFGERAFGHHYAVGDAILDGELFARAPVGLELYHLEADAAQVEEEDGVEHVQVGVAGGQRQIVATEGVGGVVGTDGVVDLDGVQLFYIGFDTKDGRISIMTFS